METRNTCGRVRRNVKSSLKVTTGSFFFVRKFIFQFSNILSSPPPSCSRLNENINEWKHKHYENVRKSWGVVRVDWNLWVNGKCSWKIDFLFFAVCLPNAKISDSFQFERETWLSRDEKLNFLVCEKKYFFRKKRKSWIYFLITHQYHKVVS